MTVFNTRQMLVTVNRKESFLTNWLFKINRNKPTSESLVNFTFSVLQKCVHLAGKFYTVPSDFCLSCLRQKDNPSSHLPHSPTPGPEHVTLSNFKINSWSSSAWQKQTESMCSDGLHHQTPQLPTGNHCWETGLHLWATEEFCGKQNTRSLETLAHTSVVWMKTHLNTHFRLFKLRPKNIARKWRVNT